MRPASLRIGALLLTFTALTGTGSAGAAGAPSAAPVLAGAFEATVAGSGHYELRATLTGGGSFTVKSDPAWTAVYPRVILPEASVGGLHLVPAPDAGRSSVQGSMWRIGGSLPGLGPNPLTLVSCLGVLQTPALASAIDAPAVDAAGARVQVTLPALPGIGPATSSCTPAEADGRMSWSGDLRTWTAGLLTTSTQELLSTNVLQRPADVTTVAGAEGRTIGVCHVAGACDQDLRWTGAVTLVKRCRNLAGMALAGGSGAFSCASPCRERSCSLEQARVPEPPGALRPRRRTISAPAACYGDSACTGIAELRAGGTRLGRSRFRLRPTMFGTVRVRLSDAGARSLRRAGRLSATLTLRLTGGALHKPASTQVRLRA